MEDMDDGRMNRTEMVLAARDVELLLQLLLV